MIRQVTTKDKMRRRWKEFNPRDEKGVVLYKREPFLGGYGKDIRNGPLDKSEILTQVLISKTVR